MEEVLNGLKAWISGNRSQLVGSVPERLFLRGLLLRLAVTATGPSNDPEPESERKERSQNGLC